MSVISLIMLIRSRDLGFANSCALNPLEVAKERFPFFKLEVDSDCFDFISFFQCAICWFH